MHKQDIAPIELKTIWDTRIRSWLQNNVLYDEKAAKAHQKYNTKQLHRVFLSSFHFIVSSPYLKFLPSQSVKNQTHHSVLHAGRYLYDKEISYLGTVILTANVYHFTTKKHWSHISSNHSTSISEPCVFDILSLGQHLCYSQDPARHSAKFNTHPSSELLCQLSPNHQPYSI